MGSDKMDAKAAARIAKGKDHAFAQRAAEAARKNQSGGGSSYSGNKSGGGSSSSNNSGSKSGSNSNSGKK